MADITPIVSLNGELAMPEKVWMQGPPGPQGQQGEPGAAATVTVGTVTTGEPGTDAIVKNIGTESAAVLNFTIPKGETGAVGAVGPRGPKGDTGETGPAGAGVPDGGTAGQLLSKTESGTAWIDPPQSGVQSDWNQNDDTQPDYVKNRPFYSEYGIVTVENVSYTKLNGFPIFAVGDTVTVTVDGVEHSLVAYDDDGFTAIGDSYINVENGEGQFGWQFSVQTYSVFFYAKEAHTVSYLASVYHTIDAKYLPENIATKSDVEVAHNKANAAQNKANAAQSTANTAKSTAEAAQSTANTAKTTADAAKTTAETAQTTAETAQTTVNGCVKKSNTGEFGINLGSNNAFSGSVQSSAVNYSFMTNDITNTPTNLNIGALGGTALKISVTPSTSPTVKITPPVYGTQQADIEFSRLTSEYPHPKIKGIGGIVMHSSTSGSAKQFRITVDDSGTISATEVT